MKAAVLHQIGAPFVLENVELSPPRSGEVCVRVAASGVCHSDWHVVSGDTKHPLPVVLGHEGAGVVEEVGPGVTAVKPGDSVILNWAPDCGRCFYCLRGRPSLCDTFIGPIWAGTMLDGTPRLKLRGRDVFHFSGLATFAERTVVPQETCVPIARDVPLEVAALVGCAVATGVGAVTRTVRVAAGDSVVVVGCGGVGLSIVQGAALVGARLIVAVDTSLAKLELARKLGATHGVLSSQDVPREVKALTEGRGADWAFEAIGLPAVQEGTLDLIRPGGTTVLVGLAPMGTATNFPSALLTRQEKSVVGCYYGTTNTHRDFPEFLAWYRAGRLALDALVTRRYRLEEINEAYRALRGGEVGRGVIVFDS